MLLFPLYVNVYTVHVHVLYIHHADRVPVNVWNIHVYVFHVIFYTSATMIFNVYTCTTYTLHICTCNTYLHAVGSLVADRKLMFVA